MKIKDRNILLEMAVVPLSLKIFNDRLSKLLSRVTYIQVLCLLTRK